VDNDTWPRFAVLGAGAVGCYFGGMLARAGAPVTMIGRPQHVDAMTRNGLLLETRHFHERVAVSASTSPDAIRGADVVLLCVKTLDTETAARELAPYLLPGVIILSLQNGVDNVNRVHAAAGIDPFAAVVYVAAEMAAPGHVKHTGRGDVVLGDILRSGDAQRRRTLHQLATRFVRAGVPCVVSDNIEGELWTKLIMNCAYNAISALARARYGRIVANAGTRELMRQATEETIAVGRAAGVRFPPGDIFAAVVKLGEAMSNALSSTAQDIGRGKRTEIDSLNGYVARRGAELGVHTPVNTALHALVKLLEQSADSSV
jgi:2-dehydropantoate 2-reductase